ncbi:MAG: hypothetical protein AAB694_02115 [Patescibacteria group bacterium]
MRPEQRRGITPSQIITQTEMVRSLSEKSGHPLSVVRTRALALIDLGREAVNSVLDRSGTRGNLIAAIAPDTRFYARQLQGTQQEQIFNEGVGCIILGTTILSLEDAIFNWEWKDKLLEDNFNRVISGTRLPKLPLTMIVRKTPSHKRDISPKQVFDRILREATRDISFQGFFTSEGMEVHPPAVVGVFLRANEQSVRTALLLYRDAVTAG